jgi:hypothetical protein
MYKMPTKKEKSALETIEAALEREKADARAAAARHKLTVERLRTSVKNLQVGGPTAGVLCVVGVCLWWGLAAAPAVCVWGVDRQPGSGVRTGGACGVMCSHALTMAEACMCMHVCCGCCLAVLCVQDEKASLLEEVRWYQAQHLNSTEYAVRDSKARKRPTANTQ